MCSKYVVHRRAYLPILMPAFIGSIAGISDTGFGTIIFAVSISVLEGSEGSEIPTNTQNILIFDGDVQVGTNKLNKKINMFALFRGGRFAVNNANIFTNTKYIPIILICHYFVISLSLFTNFANGSFAENHILEDVNKCVIALQEKDVDGLDRTAGAIRGRAARVVHVVTSEMDNYEPGVYTEKVLEATKLLTDTGTAGIIMDNYLFHYADIRNN